MVGYAFFARSEGRSTRSDADADLAAPAIRTSVIPASTDPGVGVHGTMATVTVPILVYHGVRDAVTGEPFEVRRFNVAPAMLEKQLQYILDEGFTPISFADLALYFDTGTALPSRPIIISFDDGTESQYAHALPLLQQYAIHATFFLYPNVIEHEGYMTWQEAKYLVTAGMEIGSHSKSHMYMTKQTDDEVRTEVYTSKEILERELGTTITAFAFPFGLYDDRIVANLEEAGYLTARGLEKSVQQHIDSRYTLRSYLISNDFKDFSYILSVLAAP